MEALNIDEQRRVISRLGSSLRWQTPCRADTMNSSTVWPCTSHSRTVNRSFLLELERDKTTQRAEGMKEKMKIAAIT